MIEGKDGLRQADVSCIFSWGRDLGPVSPSVVSSALTQHLGKSHCALCLRDEINVSRAVVVLSDNQNALETI